MSGVNYNNASVETLQYCKEFLEMYPETPNWDKSVVRQLMELFVKNKQEGLSTAECVRLCRLRKKINAEKQQQVSDANKNLVSCSVNKNTWYDVSHSVDLLLHIPTLHVTSYHVHDIL